MGIIDLLLPREVEFFKMMNKQADNFCQACQLFREFMSKFSKGQLHEREIAKYVKQLKKHETKGDELERLIIEKLDTTFITPLDREDIHDIATKVDDALDFLNDISQKIEIYKITRLPKNVLRFAEIIVDIADAMKRLIKSLSGKNNAKITKNILKEIHELEQEADGLFHNSMAELFNINSGPTDPVTIIKFKDIYEHLEDTVNSVEDIGSLVRGIIVKRG